MALRESDSDTAPADLEVRSHIAAATERNADEISSIRMSPDGKVVLIDFAVAIGGGDSHSVAKAVCRVQRKHKLEGKFTRFRFPGYGGRSTQVCTVDEALEIVMLLPGARYAACRTIAARILRRYLGGDQTLHAEVDKIDQLQQRLAETAPNDRRRIFSQRGSCSNVRDCDSFCGLCDDVQHVPPFVSSAMVHNRLQRRTDDLYIMRYSFGGPVKIGRSADVERRRQQLMACQAFRVLLVCQYPQMGYLEVHVHRYLQNKRFWGGPGVEWFQTSPLEARSAVRQVLKNVLKLRSGACRWGPQSLIGRA